MSLLERYLAQPHRPLTDQQKFALAVLTGRTHELASVLVNESEKPVEASNSHPEHGGSDLAFTRECTYNPKRGTK